TNVRSQTEFLGPRAELQSAVTPGIPLGRVVCSPRASGPLPTGTRSWTIRTHRRSLVRPPTKSPRGQDIAARSGTTSRSPSCRRGDEDRAMESVQLLTDNRTVSESTTALQRELVAHLRQNRAQLREEWLRRILEAELLTAMTRDEVFAEATSVYDSYVEALETRTL